MTSNMTPESIVESIDFDKRLKEIQDRIPGELEKADALPSRARRNQARKILYHDSELLRIELEEKLNEHELESEWLTAPAMQKAQEQLDDVRKQLKLEVAPASHTPLTLALMLARAATCMLLLVGWFSAVCFIAPIKLLDPILRKAGVPKNYLPMDIVAWLVANLVSKVSGSDAKAEGLEHLTDMKDSVVCMFSHASNLDGFIVNGTSPTALKFAAKKSLFMVPFLGWGARWGFGYVGIDRSNRKNALKSLRELTLSMNDHGNSVSISPEGTRSKDGHLQDFKKGPFYLREETQKNVVPAVVYGAYELWPPGRLWSLNGHTLVRYLPEFENKPLNDNPSRNRNLNRLALRRVFLKACTEDVPDEIGSEGSFNGMMVNLMYIYLIWAASIKVGSMGVSIVNSAADALGLGSSAVALFWLVVTIVGELYMYFTC